MERSTETPDPDGINIGEGIPTLPFFMINALDGINQISLADYGIVERIKFDISLVSRVLKEANGPLYGYKGSISSLQQAYGLLGPAIFKNVILTTPVHEKFSVSNNLKSEVNFALLWLHAGVTAGLAGHLSKMLGHIETDDYFTAGLIHDMGKIIIAFQFSEKLYLTANAAKKKGEFLEEAEKSAFGFSHQELGARIATRWNFPDTLIRLIEECGTNKPVSEKSRFTGIVELAKYYAHTLGYGDDLEVVSPIMVDDWITEFSISRKELKIWEKELAKVAQMISEHPLE